MWGDLFHGSGTQQVSPPHLEGVQRGLFTVEAALDGCSLLLLLAGCLLQLPDLGLRVLGLPLQLLYLPSLQPILAVVITAGASCTTT